MPKLIVNAFDENNKLICAKVIITKREIEEGQQFNKGDIISIKYIEGTGTLEISDTEIYVSVFCGKLYRPYKERVEFSEPGDVREITAILRKITDPVRKYNLYSFDAHSHVSRRKYDREKTVDLEQAAVIAKAEGFNCLIAGAPYDYDNHREARTGIIRSKLPYRKQYADLLKRVSDDMFIMDVGNEYCKYRYGHVFLFNYDQMPPADQYRDPIYYPYEQAKHIPNTEEPKFTNVPISNAVYRSKGENTVAVYAHPTSWWYENEDVTFVTNIASTLGFDILTGAVDAVVVMGYRADHKYYQDVWYDLLDNGYFVPGVAETDACMDADKFEMPPYKTYVYIDNFTLDDIAHAVKAGRCMVTSGPLLHFTVEGNLPGTRIERMEGKEYHIEITAEACCDGPLSKIEIILNGKKYKEIPVEGKEHVFKNIKLHAPETDSYVLAKCYDMAGNVAISNPVFIRNNPFVNIDYRSKVTIDVYKGKYPATGSYYIGADGTEIHFDGKVSCIIKPHETITIKVGNETKKIELFWHKPLQDIFRNLYTGEFNRSGTYKPGEVPAEAFRIREIREILDNVQLTLYFKDEDTGGSGVVYQNTYAENKMVEENQFRNMSYTEKSIPAYHEVAGMLPEPIWEGHDIVIDCYRKAWDIAWRKLRQPEKNSGLISNFLYTEFSNSIFMWGLCFITQFGKYARKSFDFIGSLNNFYAKQHKDGFICRQINIFTGNDEFHRFDPSSTGPNIMAWAEWEDYKISKDIDRIKKVFPPLVAYHRWLRKHRTWKDGTYFSSGWGCGMDNQPRLAKGYSSEYDHGHMSWIDITAQQVLSAKILIKMAREIGREADVHDMAEEAKYLTDFVNRYMWDEQEKFYFDRYRDGSLSKVKTIGAYWTLLADMVPQDRLDGFVAHLLNENEFKTYHPIPSLARNTPGFIEDGGDYWRGGVWCITNLMVVKGLASRGYRELAHQVSHKHVRVLAEVFKNTGTIWESYDTLKPEPGKLFGKFVRNDFVGFSGVGPITMLIEHVIGLEADTSKDVLVWDIRLMEGHGIKRYPFGLDGVIDLYCHPRKDPSEEPVVRAVSNRNVVLVVRWDNGEKVIDVTEEESIC